MGMLTGFIVLGWFLLLGIVFLWNEIRAIQIFVKKEFQTMSQALDDLNAVVTKIQTDVQSAIALLQSGDSAAIEAAVTKLQAVDTALEAAITPPAPPTT